MAYLYILGLVPGHVPSRYSVLLVVVRPGQTLTGIMMRQWPTRSPSPGRVFHRQLQIFPAGFAWRLAPPAASAGVFRLCQPECRSAPTRSRLCHVRVPMDSETRKEPEGAIRRGRRVGTRPGPPNLKVLNPSPSPQFRRVRVRVPFLTGLFPIQVAQ